MSRSYKRRVEAHRFFSQRDTRLKKASLRQRHTGWMGAAAASTSGKQDRTARKQPQDFLRAFSFAECSPRTAKIIRARGETRKGEAPHTREELHRRGELRRHRTQHINTVRTDRKPNEIPTDTGRDLHSRLFALASSSVAMALLWYWR